MKPFWGSLNVHLGDELLCYDAYTEFLMLQCEQFLERQKEFEEAKSSLAEITKEEELAEAAWRVSVATMISGRLPNPRTKK